MHKIHRSIQKQIGAIFGGNFRISQNQRKIWGICGGNKVKSVATFALIPYGDMGIRSRTRYGYFCGDFRIFTKNTKFFGGKSVATQGQIRVNGGSDTIWWRVTFMGGPIFTDLRREGEEREEHKMNTKNTKGKTHKHKDN
jgi:hypothetical protein